MDYNAGTQTTTVANHIKYDAFGNIKSEKDEFGNAPTVEHIFGFTARERDKESDLYYYRNRYYDPTTGRFITADPVRDDFENTYRYVNNDPVNRTDPSGLDEIIASGTDGQAPKDIGTIQFQDYSWLRKGTVANAGVRAGHIVMYKGKPYFYSDLVSLAKQNGISNNYYSGGEKLFQQKLDQKITEFQRRYNFYEKTNTAFFKLKELHIEAVERKNNNLLSKRERYKHESTRKLIKNMIDVMKHTIYKKQFSKGATGTYQLLQVWENWKNERKHLKNIVKFIKSATRLMADVDDWHLQYVPGNSELLKGQYKNPKLFGGVLRESDMVMIAMETKRQNDIRAGKVRIIGISRKEWNAKLGNDFRFSQFKLNPSVSKIYGMKALRALNAFNTVLSGLDSGIKLEKGIRQMSGDDIGDQVEGMGNFLSSSGFWFTMLVQGGSVVSAYTEYYLKPILDAMGQVFKNIQEHEMNQVFKTFDDEDLRLDNFKKKMYQNFFALRRFEGPLTLQWFNKHHKELKGTDEILFDIRRLLLHIK